MDFFAREKATGAEHPLEAPLEGTVLNLREVIERALNKTPTSLLLTKDGVVLEDCTPIMDAGLQAGDTVVVSESNKKIIKMIKNNKANVETLPAWAREDLDVVLAGKRRMRHFFNMLSEPMRANPEVALEAVPYEQLWPSIPACLWDSKPFLLEAVKKAPACYACASEAMRKDGDVAVEVCKGDYTLITLVHPSVRSTERVLLAALLREHQQTDEFSDDEESMEDSDEYSDDEEESEPASSCFYQSESGIRTFRNEVMLFAPPELLDSRDFITKAVTVVPQSILHASPRLREDLDVMRAVVLKCPKMIIIAPKALQQDDDFMRGVVAKYPPALPVASEALRGDPAILKAVLDKLSLEDTSIALHCLPSAFTRQVILEGASNMSSRVMRHALECAPSLLQDRGVMLAVIDHHGRSFFPFVPEGLKAERDFAKDAVAVQPAFYNHLPLSLREDTELAVCAIEHEELLVPLPEKLATDSSFALQVAHLASGFRALCEDFREDPEMLKIAVAHRASAFGDATLRARGTPSLVLSLLQEDCGIYPYVDEDLRENQAFIEKVRQINPELVDPAPRKWKTKKCRKGKMRTR